MPKYYLLDENKNLVEGFDKEGFLALLQQAIDQGSLENIDPESAVASKLRSLVNGTTHHIEFVTEEQYNQLEHDGELVPNTYYFITDDTTFEGYEETLNDLVARFPIVEDNVNGLMSGSVIAKNAQNTLLTNGEWQSVDLSVSGSANLQPNKFYFIYYKSGDIVVNYGLVYVVSNQTLIVSNGIHTGYGYELSKLSVSPSGFNIAEYKFDGTSQTIQNGTIYFKEVK